MSNAFAPIVRARPNPIFGRPVHQGSPPIDYSPILLLKPFGFRIAPDTLSSDENLVGQRGITPAFGYSAPHPSAGGTLTLLIHALPSAHYEGATTSRPREPGPLWFRFQAPRAPPVFVFAVALLTSPEEARQARNIWSAGVPIPGMAHPWARAGSHRFPGDPSYAFALLQDPGRAGKISPWRSCRCCPRATQAEGLNGHIISRLTQGLSIRCLRFTSDVAASHARLASGWRAAPLPGGGRTLWIASKGFRLHPFLLSRTSPVARVVYAKRPFAGPEQVLEYVGRYTHRVAISNNRVLSMDEGKVCFHWR